MKQYVMVRRQTSVAPSIRNLAAIAQKLGKSNISHLYQEKSDHEADMIHGMKRKVTLKITRVVLCGDIKNQVSYPTDQSSVALKP
jgi:hypothetical protein